MELKKDINFNEQQMERPSPYLKKKKWTDLTDGMDQVDDISKLEESSIDDSNRAYHFHQMKTKRRLLDYLENYFSSTQSFVDNIMNQKQLVIDEIVLNEGLTKVHIHWSFEEPIQNLLQAESPEQREKTRKLLEGNLLKHESYLSAKICQDLGFRFGPTVKFIYSTEKEYNIELEQDIKNTLPQVLNKILVEDLQMEKISKHEYYNLLEKYEEKLKQKITDNFDAQKSVRKLKKRPGKKLQRNENGEVIRKNKTEEGLKIKKPKFPKSVRFWNNLPG